MDIAVSSTAPHTAGNATGTSGLTVTATVSRAQTSHSSHRSVPSTGTHGGLPFTGAPVAIALVAALVLMCLGSLVLRVARHRSRA